MMVDGHQLRLRITKVNKGVDKMTELTQEYVRSLFNYRDRNLYWKVKKANNVKIGDLAGNVNKRGYRAIRINSKPYLAHRLIFLWHHGHIPEFLDHIDCNPSNNAIDNLREATRSQNYGNSKKQKFYNDKPTSSIYKGVSLHKATKKWEVQIMINGKKKHIGRFTSELDAARAYDKAAIEAFGEFVRLNIRMDADEGERLWKRPKPL